MMRRDSITFQALLAFLMCVNILVWLSVRHDQARWMNVPPVLTLSAARAGGLGDSQFAYRQAGLMLQNLGNTGGRVEKFKDYNYGRLKRWFFLTRGLDARAAFTPYMAAFYFSAVESPEKVAPLVEYLRVAGQGDSGQKWRWLAQAVFLARYKMNNLDLALELARELAASRDPTLAAWAKEMPAFVLTAKGEKQAAYEILVNLLKSDAEKLPPQEVNAVRDYICKRVLDPQQAKGHPLCADDAPK